MGRKSDTSAIPFTMIFSVEYTSLAQTAVMSPGWCPSSACGAELTAALTQLQTLHKGTFLCCIIRVQFCPIAAPNTTDHTRHEQQILFG